MVQGTGLLTVTALVGQGLGFFYRIALSRLIGAEVMGLYQLLMPAYSLILSVVSIGLTAAVSALTAQYRALGHPYTAHRILRRCLAFMALLIGCLTLVVVPGSDFLSVYFLGDARTQLGLVLLLPCALLTGVENLHKHAFYGAGRYRIPALTELLEQVVRTVAVLGLLVLFLPQYPERAVGLVVAGMVICEVFSAATLTLLYRRQLKPEREGKVGGLNRQIASVALPVAATALLGNLMGSACAVLIPQKLVEGGATVTQAMSSFGVMFGMTLPLLNLPTAFISALGLVLMPDLAQKWARGFRKEAGERVAGSLRTTSLLMLPAVGLLVVVGPSLGYALFQNENVGDYLAPLAVVTVLGCYQAVTACALNGIGSQAAAARNALLSGGLELAVVFFTVGIPGVGLTGYVAAALCSTALCVGMNLAALRKKTHLRWNLFEALVAPGLGSLLAALTGNLLFRNLLDRGLATAAAGWVSVVWGALLYLLVLRTLGVGRRTF